jgi:hypothetical protein
LEEPAVSLFYPTGVGEITYIKNNIHTLYFTEHTSNTELNLITDSDFNSINIFYTKCTLTRRNLAHRINK